MAENTQRQKRQEVKQHPPPTTTTIPCPPSPRPPLPLNFKPHHNGPRIPHPYPRHEKPMESLRKAYVCSAHRHRTIYIILLISILIISIASIILYNNVEVVVPGSPSLMVLMVYVDVKQHQADFTARCKKAQFSFKYNLHITVTLKSSQT